MRQLYIIIYPKWSTIEGRTWRVVKRNQYRVMVDVAQTTSYDAARAMLPTGLRQTGKIFDLEFWEGYSSSSPRSACSSQP